MGFRLCCVDTRKAKKTAAVGADIPSTEYQGRFSAQEQQNPGGNIQGGFVISAFQDKLAISSSSRPPSELNNFSTVYPLGYEPIKVRVVRGFEVLTTDSFSFTVIDSVNVKNG